MTIEAYRSIYGDLKKLKDDSLLKDPAAGSGDDPEMLQLLLSLSDWVEGYCNRHFYPRQQTLLIDGDGADKLPIPDLIALDTLKEDTADDQTFDVTWASSDFFLSPYNADPTKPWGRTHRTIHVRTKGSKSSFEAGQQRFQIVGRWGYHENKEDSGTDVNDASFSITDTVLAVDAGTAVEIGQTIQLDSEQMLVSGISTNDLTVTRGINGTTAATHADNVDVFILRWPPSIERAVLIQAARLWTRAADFEPYFVPDEIDTDVEMLLEPYKERTT